MCGIAGIINLNGEAISPELLEKMSVALVHRGPDESGTFINKNVGLAHRRLSIIDLESGRQPLSNEDGSIQIIFNGEIYNYKELRESLKDKGHIFKTNSDTEVIVHLYEEYGRSCVAYLNGMFAFAIYDGKRDYMLLGRDRLGKKPLLYFYNNKRFVFASEFQSLKTHPDMPSAFDMEAIHNYFSLQYIPAPSTIYTGVSKLPPAHVLEINLKKSSRELHAYWNIDYSRKLNISFEDASAALRELMEKSVRARLTSDVPYGAFLSGGIDSSIIVSIMSRLCSAPVKTFTIGFQEAKYDERHYADIAVKFISRKSGKTLEHEEKIVSADDFDVLRKLVKHYGEPFSDSSMLPTFLLSKFTREHVTVALSGDGADELFAGYNRYLVMKISRALNFMPRALRTKVLEKALKMLPLPSEERTFYGIFHRLLKIFSVGADERYFSIISKFQEEEKAQIYGDAFRDFKPFGTNEYIKACYNLTKANDYVEKMMEIDLHNYLPDDILVKVDIASMANSLEIRSPFLDYKVAEFAASLPLSFKQRFSTRKHILREAFKNELPPQIFSRKKMGFGVPIGAWFRSRWNNQLRSCLLEGKAVKTGFFRRDALERMINSHQSMKADYSHELWSLLIFELFLENN
ncbi:MAG: asparagine synthase (glutamine-hydrolyzing) [Lentisphaerae bacterium GWF2_44_16]|nr:MAG: asparagine synthase (glutamine-hydrolyzing) [Lentisphaerae bacterium GWF2_44_16]